MVKAHERFIWFMYKSYMTLYALNTHTVAIIIATNLPVLYVIEYCGSSA